MEPISIAAIGWGLTATGWFVSPYITRLLDKAYAHLKPGKSRDRIRSLVNQTVPRLKLILEAAEGSEHRNLFEGMLTELKSAFYATEDILDELEYIRRHPHQHNLDSGARFNKVRLFISNLGCKPRARLDSSFYYDSSNQGSGTSSGLTIPGNLSDVLKRNVKKIEKLIKEANETIKSANLQSNRESGRNISNVIADKRKMPTIADPIVEVTGRVEELREIKGMLRQTENNAIPSSSDSTRLYVIGIIGIPGSGKTTIAQCVCKSERDAGYFDLFIWIHVTENYDVHNIYIEIFEQASPEKKVPKCKGLGMMKTKLENVLRGKRILLVLDDVWFSKVSTGEGKTENKLQLLLSPLKVGKEGSKILLTSRQDSLSCLGREVTSKRYQIPDLDDEDFLKLFMHYALNINDSNIGDKGKFQRIGVQIAEKLKKSPLLAIAVGRTLFHKPRVEDWVSVRDQNLLNDHMGALWWCYQHLGEQVRRCFAYCSIFPRKYLLRRDELVNLWVAEGFISATNREEDAEYVGRGYFDELLSTSFLLPRGKDGKGEYFLIHDLLHDLAVKAAGNDCFKIENGLPEQVPPDVRHLLIMGCTASMITGHIVKLKQLRTLIIYDAENGIGEQVFHTMFCELRKLRVLIFKTKGLFQIRPYLPGSIDCLKHLRYLSFVTAGLNTISLPHTLHRLYFLQVLQFEPSGFYNFSNSIDMAKLVDLRHIIYADVTFPNIAKLTSLRTMPALDVGRGRQGYELHQLKHLNKIRGTLIIRGLGNVKSKEEALEAKICDKEQLTEIVLSWWGGAERVSPDVQADVFEALQPPEYLNELGIHGYKGSRCPSWMVGTRRSTLHMVELELHSCSQPVSGPELFFINVNRLVLHRCNWDTLPYNMVDLTRLTLDHCDIFPSNMECLISLERLTIQFKNERDSITLPTLPKSLNCIVLDGWGSQIREYQNWDKIMRIPEIFIDGVKFEGPTGDRAMRRQDRAEELVVVGVQIPKAGLEVPQLR